MRKCFVKHRVWVPYNYKTREAGHYTEQQEVECKFHCWGLKEEENEIPISVSVAIVELVDGTINTVYPYQVRFDTNET